MQQKKSVMTKNKKQNETSWIRTWIFDKPAMFAVLSFGIMFIVSLLYSAVASLLNISNSYPLGILLFLSLVWSIYYLIKKLPHEKMYRGDFIAITNACSLLAVGIPTLTILLVGNNINALKQKLFFMYMTNSNMLWIVFLCTALLYLYVFGIILSGIYAKYKRATEIGISKWKVICSFPFAFLLMWTPGYLINDKQNGSNLTIKTRWYSKFNKWIIANSQNTLLAFLIIVFLTNMFSGLESLLLTTFLLVIYVLWHVKHKKDFLKNINNGYALSAVSINLTIIFILLVQGLIKAN